MPFDAYRPKESAGQPLDVVFLDESHPSYPFHIPGQPQYLETSGQSFGYSPVSTEGFYHNDEAQRRIGIAKAEIFGLQTGSRALDVGWGRNMFVAQGLQSKGVRVILLDIMDTTQQFEGDYEKAPHFVATLEQGLDQYIGAIEDIAHPQSQLHDATFQLISFNGSWVAGGYNCTIAEGLDGQVQERFASASEVVDHKTDRFKNAMHEGQMQIMRLAKEHLAQDGILFFGSPRFAYHGAGYDFDRLPEEKLQQLDLIEKARSLGAKRVTLIGQSSRFLDQTLVRNFSDPELTAIRETLIFKELFLGSGFLRPSFDLLDSNGGPADFNMTKAFLENPTQRRTLLGDPVVINAYSEKYTEHLRNGKEIIRSLISGVDGLPDSLDTFSLLDPARIAQVKESAKRYMPQSVGKIDAIGIEF